MKIKTLYLLLFLLACFASQSNAQAKFGYLDKNGKIVVPFIYEEGNEFIEGKAAVKRNKKWGFVDAAGKEFIPCTYDDVTPFQSGLTIATRKKNSYLINKEGIIKDSLPSENTIYIDENTEWLQITSKTGKMGLREMGTGRMIIDTIYSQVYALGGSNFEVEAQGVAYEIDVNSSKMVENSRYFDPSFKGKYYSIWNQYDSEEILGVSLASILPSDAEYGSIEIVQDSLVILAQTNPTKIDTFPYFGYTGEKNAGFDSLYIGTSRKYGLMNVHGKWLIPPKYDYIPEHTGEYFFGYAENEWHIVEMASGKETAHFPYIYTGFSREFFYTRTYMTSSGSFVTKNKQEKMGMFSPTGKVMLPFEYDEMIPFRTNEPETDKKFIFTKKGEYFGLIDDKGNNLLPSIYTHISDENQDNVLELTSNEGKLGFFTLLSNQFIAPQYEKTKVEFVFEPSFSEGLAPISKNGKYGYIDAAGKVIIPFIYSNARHFKNGIAYVKTEKGSAFINKKGEILNTANDYKIFFDFNEFNQKDLSTPDLTILKNRHLVYKGNKYGFIDDEGKIIIPLIYGKPSHISENELIGIYSTRK